jgi:CBS domain-containing protein
MRAITIEKFVKPVLTAPPSETLAGLARLMESHNVGAIVITEERHPVGMVTDRDIALHLGARAASPRVRAAEVMSRPVQTVSRDAGIFDTTSVMKEAGVRRLPVVDVDGRVVGVVALDDLLRLLARELSNLTEGIRSEMAVKGLPAQSAEMSDDWRLIQPGELGAEQE